LLKQKGNKQLNDEKDKFPYVNLAGGNGGFAFHPAGPEKLL
jgi:hypothetical protein